jgi:hypothetical protein
MIGVLRFLGVMALAGAALLAADTSRADNRLFGVRIDQPGVIVVQAIRNGAELTVAGQGGGVTFFRIDNPDGAVPCLNRIVFTASNGRSVDDNFDLCAADWDLTISLTGSGSGSGSAGGSTADTPTPPAGNASAGGTQTVTIRTDDPDAEITEVFLAGRPVAIASRAGSAVRIEVAPDANGITCQRDLGLALADGRRLARSVNICAGNFNVLMTLVGDGTAPPPVEPPAQVPPPAPALVDNMQWLFSVGDGRATLSYGIPATDAGEFGAACELQSGETTVTLTRTIPGLQPGMAVEVSFSAGGFSRTYTATGTEISELTGESEPRLDVGTDDPLWPAIIRESALQIRVASQPPYALSLRGSAAQTRPFLAASSAPPPAGPVVGPAPVGRGAIAFGCDNGRSIGVTFDAADSTAVVTEFGAPPVVLFRTASSRGARYVAGASELIGLAETVTWSRNGEFPSACSPIR